MTEQLISKLPSSVDFMLLGTCNLQCPFCFGPRHEMNAMKTSDVKKVIRTLSENGVERVVFTGGEPTLIKELPEILQDAKSRGLTIVLSTNGMKMAKDKDLTASIVQGLDWLAIPLDGSTPKINSKMRVGYRPEAGQEHFDAVIKLIPAIQALHPKVNIKLGTVVAKPNINDVHNIPATLRMLNAVPDTWKLYQISPSEYGKINFDVLKISNAEFDDAYEKASIAAKKYDFPNVVKYTNSQRPGRYLFVNPRGDALTVRSETNDYHSIGNILNNPNGVIEGWRREVDETLLAENFAKTYPKKR